MMWWKRIPKPLVLTGDIGAIGKNAPKIVKGTILKSPWAGPHDETPSRESIDMFHARCKTLQDPIDLYKDGTNPVYTIADGAAASKTALAYIVEAGSLLCHTLIIAREEISQDLYAHQIVVVGVKHAYRKFRDGDKVEICVSDDKRTATITLLKRAN